MTTPDWARIELQYRAGQLSIKELARQHKLSDTAIHKRAKAKGWTRDLSGAVRNRVRDSLVCEGVRANLVAGGKPSEAAIIDEAAAIGVAVVRSHRRDIEAVREAAAGLLSLLLAPARDGDDEIPLIHRSRVIADLSAAMARIIPLERQAFSLDQDVPAGAGIQITWPLPRTALDD